MQLKPLNIESLKKQCEKKSSTIRRRAKRKLEVLERDGYSCVRCGSKTELTIDHKRGFKAKNRGPTGYNPEECQTMCVQCHVKKNKEQLQEKKKKKKRVVKERLQWSDIVAYCNMRIARLYEHIKEVKKDDAECTAKMHTAKIKELRRMKQMILDKEFKEEMRKLREHKKYIEKNIEKDGEGE